MAYLAERPGVLVVVYMLWQIQRKVRVLTGARGGSRQGFLRVLPGFGQN
jgi:hypothetical protein